MLAEEINVKEIEVVSEVGELVSYKLLPNSRVLGPKFGQLFPQVRKALDGLNPAEAARTLQAGEALQLSVNGDTVELTAEDVAQAESLTTLQGQTLQVTVDDGVTFINEAQVVGADIDADNGIIHAIDAVLFPDDLGK